MVADPHGNAITNVTALVEYQHTNRNRVKAKLNHKLLLGLLLERKFNSQLGAQLGIQLPLTKASESK